MPSVNPGKSKNSFLDPLTNTKKEYAIVSIAQTKENTRSKKSGQKTNNIMYKASLTLWQYTQKWFAGFI